MEIGIIFGLCFVGIGIGGLLWGLVLLSRAADTARWPRARATIEKSWVSSYLDGEGDRMYKPSVTYRYRVHGRELTARRIRIGGTVRLSWSGPAEKLVQRYPEGAEVSIAYNPTDPQDAVLEPGCTRTVWTMIAFFALWTAMSGFVFSSL